MTAQTPLDASQVRELLVCAVEEKGADYVYPLNPPGVEGPTCDYFREGEPSCIVGYVLSYMGFGSDVVPREGVASEVVPQLTGCPLADPVALALGRAQRAQDGGKPWGEALAAFDAALAEG